MCGVCAPRRPPDTSAAIPTWWKTVAASCSAPDGRKTPCLKRSTSNPAKKRKNKGKKSAENRTPSGAISHPLRSIQRLGTEQRVRRAVRCLVQTCKPHANKPINHAHRHDQHRHVQEMSFDQRRGEMLLLAEEQRGRTNEQRQAHAHQMTRDACCARNAAAQQHAQVPDSAKQSHRSEYEIGRGGNSIFKGPASHHAKA